MNRTVIYKCIQIEPRVYLYLALLLLTVPIQWVFALIIAVCIHELGHLILINALGAVINRVRIDIGGIVIESDFANSIQEMVCAAGGPMFSMMAVLLSRHYPELAICACSQTIFNLLPILPLDGGRIMACALSLLLSEDAADRAMEHVSVSCLLFMSCLAIVMVFKRIAGIAPLLIVIIAVRKYRHSKNSLQR